MSEQTGVTPRNGMAVSALTLGIIGLILSPVIIGVFLGIVAIILGILALRQPGRRGSAIVGIVTGVATLPVAVIAALLLALVPALGRARTAARET